MTRRTIALLTLAAGLAGCSASWLRPTDAQPSTAASTATRTCTPPTAPVSTYVPVPTSTDSMSAYTTAVMAGESAASIATTDAATAYSACLAGAKP